MAASEIFMLNICGWRRKKVVIFFSNLNDIYCYFFFFLKYVIFWCTKIFSCMSNMKKLPDMIYHPKLEIEYIHISQIFLPSSYISSIAYSYFYDQHNFSLFISHVFKIVSWFLCSYVLFYITGSFTVACSELIVYCCIYSIVTYFQNTFFESYKLYFISFNNFDNFNFKINFNQA